MITTERIAVQRRSEGRVFNGNTCRTVGVPLHINPPAEIPMLKISWPKTVQAGEPFSVSIPVGKAGSEDDGLSPHVQSVSFFFETKDGQAVAELGRITVHTLPDDSYHRTKTALMSGGVYTACITVLEPGTIHALVVSNRGAVSKAAFAVKLAHEQV